MAESAAGPSADYFRARREGVGAFHQIAAPGAARSILIVDDNVDAAETLAMLLEMPEPVAAYLSAEKAKDANRLALCFADDGVVHDEGRNYRGRDAILRWKQDSDTKYRDVLEPLDGAIAGNSVRVHARLTGDFPGSPIELDHLLQLADNKITSLEIRS